MCVRCFIHILFVKNKKEEDKVLSHFGRTRLFCEQAGWSKASKVSTLSMTVLLILIL